jgi:hypothetical protein
MTGNQRGRRWIRALLCCGMLASATASCNDGTPTPPKDQVLRLTPVVWAGSPATNPPLLDHYNWTSLSAGDAIKTDEAGQAEIQLDGCSGSLYVFKDGVIQVSTCLEEEQASGLATCVQVGTGYFNVECTSRFTVDTPSSRITVLGTAFSVTYVPERQLTLVIVFEGGVTVQPVIDFDTGKLAPESIRVDSGEFLYTEPGLETPKPLPFEELPPLVQELGIHPWIDDIEQRAERDRLLPQTWPFRRAVVLLTEGGAFEDPTVQRAVLAAVDKEAVLAGAFPGQEVRFRSALGREEIDARQIPYDPEMARASLEEAGYARGVPVFLLFSEGDESLTRMAEGMSKYLAEAGFEVELVPVAEEELGTMVPLMREGGKSVMWLEWR